MNVEDCNHLFKARKTVLEMISDRGYSVPESENISFEQFEIKYNNKNIDIYIDDAILSKKIYIHFYNENKNFSKSDLKTLIQNCMKNYNDETMDIILILKEKENSAITKELATNDAYKNIEVFLKKHMLFNVTHHFLVPKHSILSKEEEEKMLEMYNTTKGKVPKIPKDDPIVKYYGMKPDQICKIIRKSPSVGESVYYRLVK